MRFLTFLLFLLPIAAQADSVEVFSGFAQGSKPFYGGDYQFSNDLGYVQLSLSANSDYVQPSVSLGLIFGPVNLGVVQAVSISSAAQYSVGPELGYQYNLNSLVYVKESNSYTGFDGPFNFSCSFSLGLNL